MDLITSLSKAREVVDLDLYAQLCHLFERAYHQQSASRDSERELVTSTEAREYADRVVELLSE